MSARGTCAECDPSSASTASVSSDLHKYHVACSCGNGGAPGGVGQYAECAPTGPGDVVASQKSERPPALPPRPPPRPRTNGNAPRSSENIASAANAAAQGPRKYVWWCMGMGTAACLLGGLLLAAAFILRALTVSLHHLETIPTPIPATMLVLTGLCVMSLARRRNRYSYLIKVAGACCLVCALTCVLVTITTTVIHMNRLQTLRQCFYTDETKTCICSSVLIDGQSPAEDEGVRCVFEEVTDCNAVHGSLYRCLSAIFGLSVAGVLVCICSAMLAYQLLSHERKKMYWEQLELRCRSLYRPAANGQAARQHNQQPQVCGECCTQCHAAAVASWDLQQRFWASGRVGNLYSPNPGTGRRVSPWSWFPWPRNSNQRVGGSSSGDSAYGFGNNPGGYWQLGPPPPYTPHHRYLHHHNPGANSSHHHLHHSHSPMHMSSGCPMMSQQVSRSGGYPSSLTPHGSVSDLEGQQHLGAAALHHHHQSSLRMGMAICHQNNQTHSSIRVLQCHDPSALLSLSPGHFVPINDDDRQSDESIVHRAECHHQNANNPDIFSEKLEDLHHSQHTCQNHGQHQAEGGEEPTNSQGEENLAFQCEKPSSARQPRGGESELYFADVSSCCNVSAIEYCGGGLVGTIETQADTSSGDSDVGSCPAFKGRPLRPRQNMNFQNGNSPSLHSKNNIWKAQNSPSLKCSSPNWARKKSSAAQLESDQSGHGSHQVRSSPNASAQPSSKCKPNGFKCSDNTCQGSTGYLHDDHRSNQDMIRPSLSNINLGASQENSLESSTGMVESAIRASIRAKSSPHRNSALQSLAVPTNDLNDVGLPQINDRRKAAEESLILIANDLNLSHNKRALDESLREDFKNNGKDSDDSIADSNNSFSSGKGRNLNDSAAMNESISSFRRSHMEASPRSDISNGSPSLKQKNPNELLFKREDNFKSSFRRKGLDDSASSSSSSPLRRMFGEESPSAGESAAEHSAKMQIDESFSHNNNFNAPMRKKSPENSLMNATLESLDAPRRRSSLEDALNEGQRSSLVTMKKKSPLVQLSDASCSGFAQSSRAKLNFAHVMRHNARYSEDGLDDPSLAAEAEGSRRGIVGGGGGCLAPDLRYEPVQKETLANNNIRGVAHVRCHSDSNTMDSGWQSGGSEKHTTD